MTEHVFLLDAAVAANWPEIFGDEERRIEDAVRKLEVASEHGVETIVDRTTLGTGRHVPRVKRVAERSPVNIIVCTGLYTWNEVPFFFGFRELARQFEGRRRRIDDFIVADIEDGIGDTGVRAGVIKCATDMPGVTPGVDMVLRATARAHRRTGVPIVTHTNGARAGLEQQRVMDEEGVDFSRLVLGHIDRTPEAEVEKIEEIVAAGSTVGFDSFGFRSDVGPEMADDRTRLGWIADLCARGYASKIVLGHDQAAFSDLMPEDLAAEIAAERGTWTWLSDVGLGILRELGVGDEEIEEMTVGAPRRILGSKDLGSY